MQKSKIQRILLLRTDRIGDVVLTTPAVSILRYLFPDLQITFMARRYTEPLLKCHRHIDHIICYEPASKHKGFPGHLKLAREIRKKQFDAAIFFYPRPWLAFVVRMAGIPLRIGYGYRWYSFLFNRRIYQHRKSGNKHELIHNLSLLEPLIDKISSEICFEFDIPKNILLKKNTLLKTKNILNNDYIVLHPGNGGSAPNLSIAQYQFILQQLLKNKKNHIVITGTATELSFIKKIILPFETNRVINLAGQLDIQMLMALISEAKLFISTSTGPLHIANALGTPIIGFYCPSKPCSPDRWGPYFQQEWVLLPNVTPCEHCNPNQCLNGNCLEKISDKSLKEIIDRRLTLI